MMLMEEIKAVPSGRLTDEERLKQLGYTQTHATEVRDAAQCGFACFSKAKHDFDAVPLPPPNSRSLCAPLAIFRMAEIHKCEFRGRQCMGLMRRCACRIVAVYVCKHMHELGRQPALAQMSKSQPSPSLPPLRSASPCQRCQSCSQSQVNLKTEHDLHTG